MVIAIGDVVEVNLSVDGGKKRVLGIVEKNWGDLLMVLVGTAPTPFCTVQCKDVKWICPGVLVGWKSTDSSELVNKVASPQNTVDTMSIVAKLIEDEKEFRPLSPAVSKTSFMTSAQKESNPQLQSSSSLSSSSSAYDSVCTSNDSTNPLRFLCGVFDNLTNRANTKNLISVLSLLGLWIFLELGIRLCTLPSRLEGLVLSLIQVILVTFVVSEVALVQPAARPSSAVCVTLLVPFVVLSFPTQCTSRDFVVSFTLTLLIVAAARYPVGNFK
ncbi:unnamed protein product [Phytomonas sp. EM1]|nr:unnamed protein product [Phytomonas sp. EM1]|eukprot:CCW64379.1 unnamed protein product [Phytomonas sp. isolate EM1]